MKIEVVKDRNCLDSLEILEKEIFRKSFYNRVQLEEMYENSNYKIILAFDNDKIVGYIIAYDSYDTMEIMKIAVIKERRKESIGNRLFEKLLEETNLNIMLEVRESNVSAIKFYEQKGMKKIAVRKNYYSDNGENAWIMLLER